jgi:uncharacterized protein (TIGR04222 family)
MFPWSISGPEFLAVWFLGWVVVVAITLVVRGALKRPRGPTIGVDDLGSDELAYLIGGAPRAILAATAGLLHRGQVVLADDRLARGATPPPTVVPEGAYRGHAAAPAGPPAERYVLARLPTSVESLLDDAHTLDARYVDGLRGKGLLVDRPHGRLAMAAPSLLWIAVGVSKVGVGIARGRPVGLLVLGLVVAAWAVVLFARTPRRTTAGDAVAAAAYQANLGLRSTAMTAPAQLDATDVILACALFGPLAAPPALAAVAAPTLASAAGASSGYSWFGGSACGSGGSGCGSGGDGGGGGGDGGGCGGCGGCS